jgi:hypothetical protein
MNILDLINEIKQEFPKLQELVVNYKGAVQMEYDLSEIVPAEIGRGILENTKFQLLFDSIINSTLINTDDECSGFIQIGFTEPWAYIKYFGIDSSEEEPIEIEDSFDVDLTSEVS